jgi:biotin synthase-related radical SAM superfamily protein
MTIPESTVGVSAGTAGVVGLRPIRQADVPTTAYVMVGERCSRDCVFCTQARHSTARAHLLSRVTWPPYPLQDALQAIQRSFAQGDIVRCCLQVTAAPGYLSQTLALVRELRSRSSIPVCVSIRVPDIEGVDALLEQGAERVSLALDAACERVYRGVKGADWSRQLALLCTAAQLFPGRIGTHLMAGLGETEQEMVAVIQDMVDRQVTIGLFSFTPVAGTMWEDRPSPALPSYRRIQAAQHLLVIGACRADGFSFSPTGQIVSYGLTLAQLRELLGDGRAFQTAGCPGCNRPYYNERPVPHTPPTPPKPAHNAGRSTGTRGAVARRRGAVAAARDGVPRKALYNYPRPLSSAEIERAISMVMAGLACG